MFTVDIQASTTNECPFIINKQSYFPIVILFINKFLYLLMR